MYRKSIHLAIGQRLRQRIGRIQVRAILNGKSHKFPQPVLSFYRTEPLKIVCYGTSKHFLTVERKIVGGGLAIYSHIKAHWLTVLLTLVGTASAAYFGVSLLVRSASIPGGVTGGILVGAIGVFLLVLSPVLFIFGVIAWNSSRSVRIN
jgi:hypothetical protein